MDLSEGVWDGHQYTSWFHLPQRLCTQLCIGLCDIQSGAGQERVNLCTIPEMISHLMMVIKNIDNNNKNVSTVVYWNTAQFSGIMVEGCRVGRDSPLIKKNKNKTA